MSKTEYFHRLNQALKNHKRAIPSLILDLDILDQNIGALRQSINPKTSLRIVVKSLPSKGLVEYVMHHAGTNKLMVFHQPFLSDLSSSCDDQVDILLGKPMPINTAKYYFNTLPESQNQFDPYQQVQWLVDTKQRIEEYTALAISLRKRLKLNVEIDVGLHRGGFHETESLSEALAHINDHRQHIEFAGFMGYDPHVVKIPTIVRSQRKSIHLVNTFYQECQDIVRNQYPALWNDDLCFNGAGSPTLELHEDDSTPLNDISAGSCLVKPTTFDIATLDKYKPACFIATPILKKYENTKIAGLESLSSLMSTIKSAYKQSFFLYGGYWKADYHHPDGLESNSIFGESTNQTMVNAPASVDLDVDDFVFLRPRQSEFVMLQFGNILTYRGGEIVGEFKLLDNSM